VDTASHLIDSRDGTSRPSTTDGRRVYLKTTGGTATYLRNRGHIVVDHQLQQGQPRQRAQHTDRAGTAANIEANFAALNSHKSSFSSVVVSATTTVTDAVFGHLLALGAAAANGGVLLTVRDTAANIAGNATSQLSGSPA